MKHCYTIRHSCCYYRKYIKPRSLLYGVNFIQHMRSMDSLLEGNKWIERRILPNEKQV